MGRKPPKYCLHKATGQAVVWVKRKAVYLGKYNTAESRKKYREVLEQLEADDGVEVRAPANLTIGLLCDYYLTHAKDRYGDEQLNSEYFLSRDALDVLFTLFADKPANLFKPRDLERMQTEMHAEREWAASTIKKHSSRVKRAFKWWVRQGYVDASVWHALQTVPNVPDHLPDVRRTEKIQAVPLEVVVDTTPYLGPVVRDMVWLQLLAAMRPGEVCQLKPRDIEQSGDVWLYRVEQHKTARYGHKLVKPIPSLAQKHLAPYLNRDPNLHCFSPRDTWTTIGKKPHSRSRDFYTTGTYHQAIKHAFAAMERKGISPTRWSPNQLRHLAATIAEHALGREAVQTLLGHSNRSTADAYVDRSEFEVRAAGMRADALWQQLLREHHSSPETH